MKGAFLYIKTGKGHFAPASALAETMNSLGYEAFTDDLFTVCGAEISGFLSTENWRFMLAHPKLDMAVEKHSDTKFSGDLANLLAMIPHHVDSLERWYQANKPDFILCTHFLGGTILPGMLDKLGISIPVFSYASDLFGSVVSAYNPELAMYYVPTEQGRENIIKEGMDEKRTALCPFPLRPEIAALRGKSKAEAREKLHLADTFTVLLNMGGEGIGKVDIVEAIGVAEPTWQVVITSDLARETKAKVKAIEKKYPAFRIVTPGFTDKIGWYILASDVQMGKAGANALMESMALHRPFLLSTVLYGALGTRKFLEENHVGWVEQDDEKILKILETFAKEDANIMERAFSALPVSFSTIDFVQQVINDTEHWKLSHTIL